MNYERIVRQYRRYHRAQQRRWLRYYRRMRSLRTAIESAATARGPEGEKFAHQHRIPPATLRKARRALLNARRELRRCRSFDRLLDFVEGRIGRIWGIGELTVYDTSLRLGAFLSLMPRKVYLHAGTRAGFIGIGGDPSARAAPKKRFPKSLQQLKAYEIEDFLCTFKDELNGMPTDRVVSCYAAPGRRRE